MLRRRTAGNSGRIGFLPGAARCLCVACHGNALNSRQVLRQPAIALREALRMRIDTSNFLLAFGLAEQILVDRQRDFPAHLARRYKQQIHGASDSTLGGIFDGHHTVADRAGFNSAKHLVNRRTHHTRRLPAKMLAKRLFTKRAARPKTGHGQHVFLGPAGGYDFRKQVRYRLGGQRSRVVRRHSPEHLCFPLGPVDDGPAF